MKIAVDGGPRPARCILPRALLVSRSSVYCPKGCRRIEKGKGMTSTDVRWQTRLEMPLKILIDRKSRPRSDGPGIDVLCGAI